MNPLPDEKEKNERKIEIGSAAHALLLNQPVEIRVLEFDAYTTKASKEARAMAKDDGAIPLLTADHELVTNMIARAKLDLALDTDPVVRSIARPDSYEHEAFNEVVACWQDMGGLWCRARIDRLVIAPDRITIIDYKTTEMSAAPQDVAKAIFNNTYHLQDGFYRRAIRHLFPQVNNHEVKLDFLFIVQEQEPPHEITSARIDAPGRVIGEKMAGAGVRLWHNAMTKNEWSGYPRQVVEAQMPPYVETKWLAREVEDERFEGLAFDPMGPMEMNPYRPADKEVFFG